MDLTSDMMQLRILTSALQGRADLATLAGKSFGGKRNFYEALGYLKLLTPTDYRERYERDAVAARIVEAFPNSCWQTGGTVYEDEDPETDTVFEKAWKDLDKRLKVWTVFRRADILAGLGRYAIILIGAPGKMDEPLEKCGPEEVVYLRAYSEEDAPVQKLEADEKSPRFGQPTVYALRRVAIDATGLETRDTAQTGKPLHHTRVIHIADNLLDHHSFGTSRLKRVWNRLDDLEKVVGGGAEAFWKRADAGLQLELDPMLKLTPEAKTALDQTLEDYTHNLTRILKTRGVTVNRLGSDVADFRGPSSAIIDMISAGTGIPQRILMGSERGHLASTQDKSNWDERVQSRRTDFCETQMVRPTVDRFMELGVLPQSEEYFLDWPEMEELDEAEKVKLASEAATINQKAGDVVLTPEEIRERYLGLPPLTEDQIKKIEEQKAQKIQEAQDAMAQRQGPVAQEAFAAAVSYGQNALRSEELRTAIMNNDVEVVKEILDAATLVVEEKLRDVAVA